MTTMEAKIERAIALLAATMKRSGIQRASGFVPHPPTEHPHKQLDDVLAAAHDAPAQPPAKRSA